MRKMKEKMGFTLIELMIVVAILGILAAVAVPAFMNYMKRAKTSEATLGLDKIYEGAVTYFQVEHLTASDAVDPVQFYLPSASGPMPADLATNGERYTATQWETNETWRALSFGMGEPFFYQYQFAQECGDSQCAVDDVMRAIAHGDLDGDGTCSTFSRNAKVEKADGEGFALRSSGALFKENELE